MIEIRERQIVIDGGPRLVISGEIHYFRLQPDQWEDRILKLKGAGGNAVASYIPWLCHELRNGEIDLDGHTRPALDLGAFIDLCRAHGLWFIARPGPFVMAEMKNEGVPYRLYTDHPGDRAGDVGRQAGPDPDAGLHRPGVPGRVPHVVLARHPDHCRPADRRGGNVIALQLDNEVGMLSWVSNSPDLTDHVLHGVPRLAGDAR